MPSAARNAISILVVEKKSEVVPWRYHSVCFTVCVSISRDPQAPQSGSDELACDLNLLHLILRSCSRGNHRRRLLKSRPLSMRLVISSQQCFTHQRPRQKFLTCQKIIGAFQACHGVRAAISGSVLPQEVSQLWGEREGWVEGTLSSSPPPQKKQQYWMHWKYI